VRFTKPYIFLILQNNNRKIMAKMLEILGLGLVAIMTLGFVGVFESYGINKGMSSLFWGCAGGALMIIIYRKIKRKQEEKES